MVTATVEQSLRSKLRRDGLTDRAVAAVWPTWWSAEAEGSASATAELRYTLARRLGLSPSTLFDDRPEFVWRNDARFKNLGDLSSQAAAVLASFCVGVGRHLISAAPDPRVTIDLSSPLRLRHHILRDYGVVNLYSLLAWCWVAGVPVVQLRLFPLRQKGMHAVATRAGHRHTVLIGRESQFQAQVGFWLAHELGHIGLGHVGDASALLDVEYPVTHGGDSEERAADAYALSLLTGSESPTIDTGGSRYTSAQLANAVRKTASRHAIDPGVLALCTAYVDGTWKEAYGALKYLNDDEDVGRKLNDVAMTQLIIDELGGDNGRFLRSVLGLDAQ